MLCYNIGSGEIGRSKEMADYLRGKMVDFNFHNQRNCKGSCFVVKKTEVCGTWGWLNGGCEDIIDWSVTTNGGFNHLVFDAECRKSAGRTPLYEKFKAICL